MRIGDLVYLKPKNIAEPVEEYIGLIVKMQKVGRSKIDSTVLYDVLLNETSEVISISDIYFEIWRIE